MPLGENMEFIRFPNSNSHAAIMKSEIKQDRTTECHFPAVIALYFGYFVLISFCYIHIRVQVCWAILTPKEPSALLQPSLLGLYFQSNKHTKEEHALTHSLYAQSSNKMVGGKTIYKGVLVNNLETLNTIAENNSFKWNTAFKK